MHGQRPSWRRENSGRVKQQNGVPCVSYGVEADDVSGTRALHLSLPAHPQSGRQSAEAAVGALYEAQALGLIRMAYVTLGDLPSAEDVVQEAFCSLYRRWDRLKDTESALYYVRASVLNNCRSALRRQAVRRREPAGEQLAASAEAEVLLGEEREEVVRAIARLPHRQREVMVLRFYSDLPDKQIARVMGIRQSTVRSTAHRALQALGRTLRASP